jgi:hypothetical protein
VFRPSELAILILSCGLVKDSHACACGLGLYHVGCSLPAELSGSELLVIRQVLARRAEAQDMEGTAGASSLGSPLSLTALASM